MGKRRNCSLQAISPFPTVFSRLVLQTCKNQDLIGKGLTPCHNITSFDDPKDETFLKTLREKRENAGD